MPPALNQSSQATSTLITSAGIVFTANQNRRFFSIQNLGTNPVYVYLGAGAVAGTTFTEVIKAGTLQDDGLGGSYKSLSVVYTGIISIDGTAPRVIITEI